MPVEHCSSPVALAVCVESRVHTLNQYQLIVHLTGSDEFRGDRPCSFYVNPRRDILWLNYDFYPEKSWYYESENELLASAYGAQMGVFTTLLVVGEDWPVEFTIDEISGALKSFTGINTILVEPRKHKDMVLPKYYDKGMVLPTYYLEADDDPYTSDYPEWDRPYDILSAREDRQRERKRRGLADARVVEFGARLRAAMLKLEVT